MTPGKQSFKSFEYVFRLFAYMLDHDNSQEFNLGFGPDADHPVSDGNDDPYTDRLYWMSPTDNTPGTLAMTIWSQPSRLT